MEQEEEQRQEQEEQEEQEEGSHLGYRALDGGLLP